MLEALRSDSVFTERAKDLKSRILRYKLALRKHLLPIVASEGYALGFLLSGVAIIESVFAWPGIGEFLVDMASSRDLPALMGLDLIITLFVLFVNLVTDISCAVVDSIKKCE